ncbi:serine/threonine protein kinase [Nonomuraea sp. NN258]|uniref:serine/threonine-protein kinase n=1 Tax=Nonomuraea antri TaxID=2730852 RepID=UPI0015687D61|nr:serine/threonine-protein kinase [Nonomuraea antri]NRQ32150.1 serine/threonine protein kinase [Nonomuraea antri]
MVTPLTPDDPVALGGYRLAGRLGEGGQGVVYLAHAESGEPVAVKLLSTGDKETRARLARELEALEGIASFCTARVLDVATGGPRPYVVSEFVDGPSLADRVGERGPLRGGDLERLAVGTATALAAIHAAGIVHRDFKPANVLLGPDGPRVVDFGIARAEGAATLTSGLIGTPAYLAPEQINGSPATAASDVFAWAATILYAATGTSPFGADTVPAVLQRVLYAEPDLGVLPGRLRGLIGAALSKDPARRPAARDLMVALVNPNHPVPPPPPPPPARGPMPGPGQPHVPSGPRYGPGSQRVPADGGPPTGPGGVARTAEGGRRGSRALLAGVVAAALAIGVAGGTVLWLNSRTPPPKTGDTASTATTGEPSDQTSGQPSDPASQAPHSDPLADLLGALSTDSLSTATISADPSLKIPAAFAGTWSGTADGVVMRKQFKDDKVTIVLKAGQNTGTWESPGEDPGCAKGVLRLTAVTGERLTFSLGGLSGRCAAIDMVGGVPVTLDRKPGDKLAYELTLLGSSKGELSRTG